MKRRNEIIASLVPLVITLSLYLVFYDTIECKPNHAGFWFILALGASIGVAIARLSTFLRKA
jgi:hypothetical protein